MEKTIKIGNTEVRLRASALIPRQYRYNFGRDLIADMVALEKSAKKAAKDGADLTLDDITVFENVTWLMARNADPLGIPNDIDIWLDSLDGVISIYQILPEVISLWNAGNRTTAVPRKK